MKFTSMILAAGLLAAPAVAMAQDSAPTPRNTGSPGGVSTPAPTNQTQLPGELRAKPPADTTMSKTKTTKTMKSHSMAKRKSRHMTTGSGKPTAVPLNAASGTDKK